MKLRFRSARWLFIVLQIIASIIALIVTIPSMIILFAFFAVPGRDYTPSGMFHSFRQFFFRVFAGRGLRPFTLRTSLPAGPSIRADGNTTI